MVFNKILCIQNRQLGDVLMCTPALNLLRKYYPNAEIHFITEYAGTQVLLNNPAIDKIITVGRKDSLGKKISLVRKIKNEKYDLLIDFFNNPTSALITFFSRANVRCGFSSGSRQWAYNNVLHYSDVFNLEYAARTKSRLLELLGMKFEKIPPIKMIPFDSEREFAKEFWNSVGVENKDKIIALCPVSRREYKIWPAEKYAYIADKLIEKYKVKIFLVYGPGEYDMARAVADNMSNKAIIGYDIPSLRHLRTIFERCMLYFGNDGGNRHIAITAGLPTVTIFRQLNPENWTPNSTNLHIAFAEGNPGQPPLNSIDKDLVLNKMIEILTEIQKGEIHE